MRIKAFQNFSLGKLGVKSKKEDALAKESQTAEIANLEEKVNNQTKELQEATEKLNGLKTEAGIEIPIDDIPVVRPHGPAAELTLEDEDLQDTAGIKLDEIDADDSIKIGEEIKIAEVSAETAAAAKAAPVTPKTEDIRVTAKIKDTAAPPATSPAEEKKEETKEEKPEESDSLNNLFSAEEEEENPLASLINSLPDVTVQELLDDLAEIHRIIDEWKPSSQAR